VSDTSETVSESSRTGDIMSAVRVWARDGTSARHSQVPEQVGQTEQRRLKGTWYGIQVPEQAGQAEQGQAQGTWYGMADFLKTIRLNPAKNSSPVTEPLPSTSKFALNSAQIRISCAVVKSSAVICCENKIKIKN
jgi:hypothetical protein